MTCTWIMMQSLYSTNILSWTRRTRRHGLSFLICTTHSRTMQRLFIVTKKSWFVNLRTTTWHLGMLSCCTLHAEIVLKMSPMRASISCLPRWQRVPKASHLCVLFSALLSQQKPSNSCRRGSKMRMQRRSLQLHKTSWEMCMDGVVPRLKLH